MTKPIVISNHADWDDIIIRCASGCDDFLVFSSDLEDDEDPWIEIDVAAEMRPYNFWQMLKGCWALFRHGRWHRASVGLDHKRLVEIRDWCQNMLDTTYDLD